MDKENKNPEGQQPLSETQTNQPIVNSQEYVQQNSINTTREINHQSINTPSSILAIVGFIFAILLPPIGFIISSIALMKINNNKARGKGFAIAGIVIGAVFTITALSILLVSSIRAGNSNQAQTELKPIANKIQQLGGQIICEDGDNGHSLSDNTTPWDTIYYSIKDTNSLTNEIKNYSSSQGYQLTPDTSLINQLKGISYVNGTTKLNDSEGFSSTSNYLVGNNNDKSLTISINRNTFVKLNCGVKNYGQKMYASNNNDIIVLSLMLPSTKQ